MVRPVRLLHCCVVVAKVTIIISTSQGTIKRLISLSVTCATTKFKFHYGTIKSAALEPGSKTHDEFQFHYGTIKS